MLPCFLLLLGLLGLCFGDPAVYVVRPASLKPSNYPRWAHYQWVWLHNAYSNAVDINAMVKGYQDNHIPFGAVNVDSTWATQFNNFEPDPSKFPDFSGFVKNLHDQGIKVTLWLVPNLVFFNP